MPSRGRCVSRFRRAGSRTGSVPVSPIPDPCIGSDGEQGQDMASLRTQVTGEGDSTVISADEIRLADAVKERSPAAMRIKQESAGREKRFPVVLGLAVAGWGVLGGGGGGPPPGDFPAPTPFGVLGYPLFGFRLILAVFRPLLFF